ncbi:hypothetical protein D3C87_1450070 [compost metagenome]
MLSTDCPHFLALDECWEIANSRRVVNNRDSRYEVLFLQRCQLREQLLDLGERFRFAGGERVLSQLPKTGLSLRCIDAVQKESQE